MNLKDKEFCLKLFSLSESPTIDELKKKYRELIKTYHPDKHPDDIAESTRMVQQINEAYEILLAHLHRIFSHSPPSQTIRKNKTSYIKNPDSIISMGDEALRDAVIIGWIKRTPKGDFAQNTRKTVEKAYILLNSFKFKNEYLNKIIFYKDLFSAFLNATVEKTPGPLPNVINATKFFHHMANANSHLDSGIRNYYRFTENRKKLTLANIPLSFLEDGIHLYSILKNKIEDSILKDKICAKLELAELFKRRIQDQDFTSV